MSEAELERKLIKKSFPEAESKNAVEKLIATLR